MEWETFKKDRYGDTLWCEAVLRVKNNETGEINESIQEEVYCKDFKCPSTHYYSEGNASCDCNRALLFGDGDVKCGQGKYSVQMLHPQTREVHYEDGDW